MLAVGMPTSLHLLELVLATLPPLTACAHFRQVRSHPPPNPLEVGTATARSWHPTPSARRTSRANILLCVNSQWVRVHLVCTSCAPRVHPCAPRVHFECTSCARGVHHACTRLAPHVHMACTPRAPRVHLACTWDAPHVHRACTWRAPHMHLACT